MQRSVLIVRPVWPVLKRIGGDLSARGYRVSFAASWSSLLEGRPGACDLAAVFLGEYGNAAEEEAVLRRFRGMGGVQGVPVLLVGGSGALRGASRFRGAGADMVFPADLSGEEILDRARPLLAMGEMYREAVSTGRELSDLAMRDGLTGLPDRRRFSLDLDRCAETARRIGRPLSCIVTDIDDLRRVNETFGQAVGDGVVRQFGSVLNRVKRRYDTVARLGGDEFVWLLLGAGAEEAVRAADRAHRTVSGCAFDGVRDPVRITATFGVSSLVPGAGWNPESLVENADRALYWGKESGKNLVRFYPPAKEAADA